MKIKIKCNYCKKEFEAYKYSKKKFVQEDVQIKVEKKMD